jgi:Zn-dependent M28 family amino/carboxypeptidase
MQLLSQVDDSRLEGSVRELEGPRHPQATPEALARAESLVADELSTIGLAVERPPFDFRGATYNNVVGRLAGSDPDLPALLVGAHFDTVSNSPGADDNASGVAVLLEVARHAAGLEPRRTLEFVGFNLEEPQDFIGSYRVGSSRFAREARRRRRRYAGALILEMVGYTDRSSGSQQVPPLVFKRVPDSGTFLTAVGDGRSRRLLRAFRRSTERQVPGLTLVTYRAILRGFLLPLTRLSDNASFWDRGYPSLMITDTAFLRNPHYHMATDSADTLDYRFMGEVARAVLAAVVDLAGTQAAAEAV